MRLQDSRRLPGPNVLSARPGALVELVFSPEECAAGPTPATVRGAWRRELRGMLEALGWQDEVECTGEVMAMPDEASGARGLRLAFSAPLDALYAATEVNEWALSAALGSLGAAVDGLSCPKGESFSAAVGRLRGVISAEARPELLALREAAHARGLIFLSDDDQASVGAGCGARTFPVTELPDVASFDFDQCHDIPHVTVTGTNGKSTTVRLLASMVQAAGLTPGLCSTDWIRIGDEIVDEGDWSGPGGARHVLRDRRVDVALLETARGGLVRRGLALERSDLALVLNVGADHLGDWGTPDLETLAEAKFIVTRGARRVVLNGDDSEVVAAAERLLSPEQEIIWFGLDVHSAVLAKHLARGGGAAYLVGEQLVLQRAAGAETAGSRKPEPSVLAELGEVPMTMGGAARHNVANALADVAAADLMGLPAAAISAGLRDFASDPQDNPGRLNEFAVNGARVLVDFAHNPDGVSALCAMAAALPAERRLILLGQAGDRDEASIRDMTRIVWDSRPDHIIIKELPGHLRGRELGEIPAMIEDELRRAGAVAANFSHAEDEPAAVEQALAWARAGDLVLLLTHEERVAVLKRVAAAAVVGD